MDRQCPVYFGPSGPDDTATWRLKGLELEMGTGRFRSQSLKNEVSFVFESSGGRHSESDVSFLGEK